ncbi:MAG: hypothetical protein WBR26_23965 [Candidatus Acidiferrum sp.]
MLDDFQTHEQILFDLSANYLEPLNGAYQRLEYLSNLLEQSSAKYVHNGLAEVYSAAAVDQVVAHCHEQVFERLLEMSLRGQEEDLRNYLESLPGTLQENIAWCRQNSGNWAPAKAPAYLKELYFSNLRALLELLGDKSRAHPDS